MPYSKSDYEMIAYIISDLSLFTECTEDSLLNELIGLCWDEGECSVIKHYMEINKEKI